MSSQARRSRRQDAGCLSDLALDRLALGEITGGGGGRARAHLAACASCAAAADRLARDREDFQRTEITPDFARLATPPPREIPRPPAARAWRWAPFALAGGAAAALGLVIDLSRPDGVETGTRTKGGLALSADVQSASGGAAARHFGAALGAGDKIQLRLTSYRAGQVAVIGIDEAGHTAVYFPPGDTTEAVPAGHEVPLRTAIELDDAPGTETLHAVRCETVMSVRAIAEALRGPDPEALPCAQTRYRIVKARRP